MKDEDVLVRTPHQAPRHLRPVWLSALHAPLPAAAPRGLPARIAQEELYSNVDGALGLYLADGPVDTRRNAFFQPLGTNGRSCFSCHQPASGMSISTAALRQLFRSTGGRDPVFAPVDGADCPSRVPGMHNAASPIGGRRGAGRGSLESAYSLLLNKGLFRVFLPVPKTTASLSDYGGEVSHPTEFSISVLSDPTGCNTDPAYSTVVDPVTQEVTRIVSVYRRPRMSANLAFMTMPSLTLGGGGLPNIDFVTGEPVLDRVTMQPISGNIMWDGREPTLESQARDATLGHAQATTPPTDAQVAEMVAFEKSAYSAQAWSSRAGDLTGRHGGGVFGGPRYMARQSATFGGFALYDSWMAPADGSRGAMQERASIARGQAVFNGRTFSVDNVAGFNNATLLGVTNPVVTTCASCHGNMQAGSDPFPAGQRAIGTGGQSRVLHGPAPAKDLPLFKLVCRPPYQTPFEGAEIVTNDPGLALITGRCADIGRKSVPQIRALAGRAPYFSDGSAATVGDVVRFYDRRFSIGLTDQELRDLTAFLKAL